LNKVWTLFIWTSPLIPAYLTIGRVSWVLSCGENCLQPLFAVRSFGWIMFGSVISLLKSSLWHWSILVTAQFVQQHFKQIMPVLKMRQKTCLMLIECNRQTFRSDNQPSAILFYFFWEAECYLAIRAIRNTNAIRLNSVNCNHFVKSDLGYCCCLMRITIQ
jgi:hypothetical protein